MREVTVVVMIICLVLGGFMMGYGRMSRYIEDVDYFITLDHHNIIIEDREGEVVYYDDADSISTHINRVNL